VQAVADASFRVVNRQVDGPTAGNIRVERRRAIALVEREVQATDRPGVKLQSFAMATIALPDASPMDVTESPTAENLQAIAPPIAAKKPASPPKTNLAQSGLSAFLATKSDPSPAARPLRQR
jgi:hypothetical protein